MFSPEGPSVRELAVQALSSVEGGYDLLAPKFDHTPFRTPDSVLDAAAGALRPLGPFGRGLDVCCGTGAGPSAQIPVRGTGHGRRLQHWHARAGAPRRPDTGWVRADVRALPFAGAFDLAVSFGALGHFLPAERPALFAGVHRALRPAGFSRSRSVHRSPSPQAGTGRCSGSTWPCGSAMPSGVPRSSCTTSPAAARGAQRPDGIRVHRDDSPADRSGPARGRQPPVRACPRTQGQPVLTAVQARWTASDRGLSPVRRWHGADQPPESLD